MRLPTLWLPAFAALCALAPCAALAQEGPTLAATLDFIRGKINAQGAISYTGTVTDTTAGTSFSNQWQETSTSAPEPAACVFHYHWKQTLDGKTAYEGDYGATLSAVTDIQRLPKDAVQNKIDADGGHANWTFQTSTPVWEVQIIQGSSGYAHVAFTDQDTADRVAKAFAHAAQLCGGLKPEAF